MQEFEIHNRDELILWQQDEWQLGRHVRIEEIIQRFAWLAAQDDTLLDLIYSEVLLREDVGEKPASEEYTDRFPHLAESIVRQFQVHRALLQDLPSETGKVTEEFAVTYEELPRNASESGTVLLSSPGQLPKISGFEILNVAGRGGSGVAYRAIDNKLKRIVAVKVLDISHSADPVRSRQLLREAEAAASLVHPNIVQVFQVGEMHGTPFLVMEFIDGGSLAQQLKAGPMPPKAAIDLMLQVSDAVRFAHQKGIIHRDLKPGNILLDARGLPHVCDFGLARHLNSDETVHVTGD
ncbi:MAG: serine/threonine protein kinase, partial [Planctomycetaceae bacterium]|nr:serine/threonine protein kinase [Planctomycetaceae bacterium]